MAQVQAWAGDHKGHRQSGLGDLPQAGLERRHQTLFYEWKSAWRLEQGTSDGNFRNIFNVSFFFLKKIFDWKLHKIT